MATRTSVSEARRSSWLRALERLRPTPAPHRDERITRQQALLLLRCSEGVLNDLCYHGLPHCGTPPAERYDRSDLTNLALTSGSNRSLPELGATFISRMAAAAPHDWVSAHGWILHTRAFALHDVECGENPTWRIRSPTLESFGGRCCKWDAQAGLGRDDDSTQATNGPAALGVSGRVLTRGETRVVRSHTLRQLFREVLETMNFHALPVSLEQDVESIIAMQAADCVGLSVLLEHECRRAGYHAVARRGYLLGLLGIGEHSWLEVVDDDARMKILDPALPMVARRSHRPTPAFTAFCLGSISNRLLPFDCPVNEQIIEHRCGGVPTPSHAIISVEAEDAAQER